MSKTFTAALSSFKAFNAAVAKAFDAEQSAVANANAATLRAVILSAMMRPGATVTAVVEHAYSDASINIETERRDRLSMARGVVSFLRQGGKVPTVIVGEDERDVLAKLETFASTYTLRGLYTEYSAPRKEKVAEKRDERKTTQERAETDAREAAGVSGPAPWSLAKLQSAVSPVIEAATAGDPNAIAMLEALRASIAAAIVAGGEVIAAAQTANDTVETARTGTDG